MAKDPHFRRVATRGVHARLTADPAIPSQDVRKGCLGFFGSPAGAGLPSGIRPAELFYAEFEQVDGDIEYLGALRFILWSGAQFSEPAINRRFAQAHKAGEVGRVLLDTDCGVEVTPIVLKGHGRPLYREPHTLSCAGLY
jgi:hypothetical protein